MRHIVCYDLLNLMSVDPELPPWRANAARSVLQAVKAYCSRDSHAATEAGPVAAAVVLLVCDLPIAIQRQIYEGRP